MRTHIRLITEADDEAMLRINQEEQRSLNHIYLMQDPKDVISYSHDIKKALSKVKSTRKEHSSIMNPEDARNRIMSLNTQM